MLNALPERTKSKNLSNGSEISNEASRQNGSTGIGIIRPTDKESKPEYLVTMRMIYMITISGYYKWIFRIYLELEGSTRNTMVPGKPNPSMFSFSPR